MRSKAKWLLAVGILLAVPILFWLVSGWLLDARVERLSAALDKDLDALSSTKFSRPPLPGDPSPGTAYEYFLAALAKAPERTDFWFEDSWGFEATGELKESMHFQVGQAQDALNLMEQGARTTDAGRWLECGSAGGLPPIAHYRVSDLTVLASMDATRRAHAGDHAKAVDRCLAAIRLGRDQSRYASIILGEPATRAPLKTLVRIRDRLPLAERERALRFLELERSIPHPAIADRMGYLALECDFRDALRGDEERIACWGEIHTLKESGSFIWSSYSSGWRGQLDRRARRSRVRKWLPDAWELLREELAARLSGAAPLCRFEEACTDSDNPAIRYLGIGQRMIREAREEGERDFEATIGALRSE